MQIEHCLNFPDVILMQFKTLLLWLTYIKVQ